MGKRALSKKELEEQRKKEEEKAAAHVSLTQIIGLLQKQGNSKDVALSTRVPFLNLKAASESGLTKNHIGTLLKYSKIIIYKKVNIWSSFSFNKKKNLHNRNRLTFRSKPTK